MGLLEDLIGSLTASDRNVSQDQASVLVKGVLESLAGGGADAGIDGLSRRFQGAGLGDAIASWIGTGANQPVEPSQLDRALRGSPLEAVTSRAGLGGIAGAAAMAVLLPKLIDRLTPKGQVPPPDRLREMAVQAESSDRLRGPGPFAQAAESGSPGGGGGSQPKPDFSKVRSGASSTAPPPAAEEKTYTVAAGDSLSKISKKVYGDANQWKRIFEANRDQISNPDLIHPGQVLRIPN
jgi:nucleoid-associated protein YgaU